MRNIETLIKELEIRMEKDQKRMWKWRQFHRSTAVIFNMALIILPAFMAVGLISYSDETLSKIFLFLITILGGVNAAFKPSINSQRRRLDMSLSRRLYDEYRGELAVAGESDENLFKLFNKYSAKFSEMYESRSKWLIEKHLELQEQKVAKSKR